MVFTAFSDSSELAYPYFTPRSSELGILSSNNFEPLYGHGISAEDYDNDGDVDFFLCTNYGEHDKLYQNQGNGSFIDVAIPSGINLSSLSRASLWVDVDGDHLIDLVVATEDSVNSRKEIILRLFKQSQPGSFTEISEPGLHFSSDHYKGSIQTFGGMAAGDLNNDQYMDIVCGSWYGSLTIFMNNGDGTFQNQTQSSQIDNRTSYYWQPMIFDINDDGFQDIYCNLDLDKNELWMNNGDGTFNNKASEYGALSSSRQEMGMDLGDFDNDGDIDIYATNISYGNTQHNILLENITIQEQNLFRERAVRFNVAYSGWDWGCVFDDYNNDGWLDLAVTNGWCGASRDSVRWKNDRSKIWLNQTDSFLDISDTANFSDRYNAASLISIDTDNDGDVDLLQSLKSHPNSFNIPVIIYENNLNDDRIHGYVKVTPRMHGTNHYAIGTKVYLSTNSLSQQRIVTAGASFYGQKPSQLHFGLGNNDTINEIKIEWPDNRISIYKNLQINTHHILFDDYLSPPQGISASIPGSGNLKISIKSQLYDEIDGYELQYSLTPDFAAYNSIYLDNSGQWHIEDADFSTSVYLRLRAFRKNLYSDFSHISLAPILSVQEDDIPVFPIPSKGTLFIKNKWSSNSLEYVVYELNGSVVSEGPIYDNSIMINDLPPAMYILGIRKGDDIVQKTLISIIR